MAANKKRKAVVADSLDGRVVALLRELGMTKSALARGMGLNNPQALNNILRISQNPTMDTLKRMAKALGCSVGYLVGERVEKVT